MEERVAIVSSVHAAVGVDVALQHLVLRSLVVPHLANLLCYLDASPDEYLAAQFVFDWQWGTDVCSCQLLFLLAYQPVE